MTPETKNNLLRNVETRLIELSSEIDKLGTLFNQLETYQKFLEEQKISNAFESLRDLLNFRIIIGIVNLDLCSATLTYLRGKFQYESISASRQMIVVINEGYKKIYNFIMTNEKGDEISKYRNNSFWIKEIGQIINLHLPECKPHYDNITKKLDNYLDVNLEILKAQRDLSVHYDKEPMKVYKMLVELDIEDSFKKLIPFLNILNELFTFTQRLADGFRKKADQVNLEQNKRIDDITDLLDKYKSINNENLITEFKQQLLSLKNLYGQ